MAYHSDLTGEVVDEALTDIVNHTTLYGAEAWAKGTKGGVEVGSSDPTYHNNAKYYAELAESAVPVGVDGAVLWSESQSLAESSKKIARTNIGAINGDIIGMRGWNQLVKNGNFADTSLWTVNTAVETFSVSGNIGTKNVTATNSWNVSMGQTGITTIVGHKYLISASIRVSDATNWRYRYPVISTAKALSANTWTDVSGIVTATLASGAGVQVETLPIGGTLDCKNFQLIDLTALFGSGNEPTTVAEFRSMFPADYYPYYNSVNKRIVLGTFTSSSSMAYTGLSYTIPKNSFYALRFKQNYINAKPLGIALSISATSIESYQLLAYTENCGECSICGWAEENITVYVWCKANTEAQNNIWLYAHIEEGVNV